MPARLRPTAPIAPDAVLVGDPGRALLLAQELLVEPKMSNHARGLWGYSGRTPAGNELTIQSTGMGGPSAALVLADLAKLGVRRAVRVGTCAAADAKLEPGELLMVDEAVGAATGRPEPELMARLRERLGGKASGARIASLDDPHAEPPTGVAATDMQTATLLSRAKEFGVAIAAVLIVERSASGERVADDVLEGAAKHAGQAARDILST
jgi:uridine phosphorylase